MANVRNGNTVYADSTGDVIANTTKNVLVSKVVISPTAASAVLILREGTSGNPLKVTLKAATDGETKVYDFSDNPLVFPNGVNIGTITNCVATLILRAS